MHRMLLALLLLQAPAVLQNQNGSLTGRVRRPDDQPAVQVRIAAMAVPEGNAPASSGVLASLTESDEEGRYRLENVPPGRYYIIAGLVDFPTYYPGALDLSGATVVEVTARNAVTGIDFVMRRPASVRVTGRLVRIADPQGLVISMMGGVAAVAPLQTTARADGSFEFPRVPLGSYTIWAPEAAYESIIIRDNDVTIDLEPQYEGPGVKVSGKVGGVANLPAGSIPVVVLHMNVIRSSTATAGGVGGVSVRPFSGGSSNTLDVRIRPDGTFEFPRVPPGTYSLGITPMVPGVVPGNRFDVGDMDITGLTLQIPFQMQIAGRMVTEGANPPERASIMFSTNVSMGNFSMGTAIQNGTFRINLIEGEHRVSVSQLPVGYVVKSITYDGADVSQSPITISPATVPKEVLVTLGVVPVDSVPGVRVSGRVLNPAAVPRVSLRSETSGVTMADVPVNPDGSFLFPKVPPGLYFLFMGAVGGSRGQLVRVETQDITNLVIGDQ